MIDLYADADFAGPWNTKDFNDPICTKSRTGVLVTISNVPLLWKLKLQTKTAISTMVSEYIALSQGKRELVAIKALFEEMEEQWKLSMDTSTRLKVIDVGFFDSGERLETIKKV